MLGLQNREGAFQQKAHMPLPDAKKRRCLTRCCSLRNQKVPEVKQKQIRRDARREETLYPMKNSVFSCFSVPPPLCFYPFSSLIVFLALSLSISLVFLCILCIFFFMFEFLAQQASNLQK